MCRDTWQCAGSAKVLKATRIGGGGGVACPTTRVAICTDLLKVLCGAFTLAVALAHVLYMFSLRGRRMGRKLGAPGGIIEYLVAELALLRRPPAPETIQQYRHRLQKIRSCETLIECILREAQPDIRPARARETPLSLHP